MFFLFIHVICDSHHGLPWYFVEGTLTLWTWRILPVSAIDQNDYLMVMFRFQTVQHQNTIDLFGLNWRTRFLCAFRRRTNRVYGSLCVVYCERLVVKIEFSRPQPDAVRLLIHRGQIIQQPLRNLHQKRCTSPEQHRYYWVLSCPRVQLFTQLDSSQVFQFMSVRELSTTPVWSTVASRLSSLFSFRVINQVWHRVKLIHHSQDSNFIPTSNNCLDRFYLTT